MDHLRTFYRRMLGQLLFVLLLWSALVPTLQQRVDSAAGADTFASDAVRWIGSRPALLLLIFSGEWLVRNWLWRRVHPRLDLAGRWKGVTTYEAAHVKPDSSLPRTSDHEALITQDCLTFRLEPSGARDFVAFFSSAANMSNEGVIEYAYEVTYASDRHSEMPVAASGIERLYVVERGTRGRPQRLAGRFTQGVQPGVPVYTGSVTFERQPHEPSWLGKLLRRRAG